MAGFIGGLREVDALLANIIRRADDASAAAQKAVDDSKTAAESLARVEEKSNAATSSLMGMAASAQAAAAAVRTSLEGVDSSEAWGRIRKRLGEFEEQATRLDDLKLRLQGSSNEWDAELKLMIGAVEVGAKKMSDLMSLWGDAVIDGKRLREFLDEMPFDYYERRLNDLIHGISDGSKSVADAITLLKGSQIEFAQGFANILEAFQKGKATLQAVLDAARAAQQMFPDSQFSDLAQTIAQSLLRRDL